MEQEKIGTQKEIPTESVNVENVGIGEDVPQIEAKRVSVLGYKIEQVQSKGKDIGGKLVLRIKHPDVDNELDISSAKYLHADKLKVSGLWVKLDKDGKIPYKSALANLLRFYNKPFIKDFINIEVDTVIDDGGYLTIKAY